MPEGHVLHRLADELTAGFGGRVVAVSSPQGRFTTEAMMLDGSTLVAARARGKHLFIEFTGERIIHVHLGLIGSMTLGPARPVVGQVRLRLATDTLVADLRGPQGCRLTDPQHEAAMAARLGPDPLDPAADPALLLARVRTLTKPVGTVLLDQAVLSGVGNVYRAEVLFRLGIDPLTPAADLPPATWRAIWDDLVVLMAEGKRQGRIDTVRPEHTPEAMSRSPRTDDHGGEVYVYRRTDEPCLVCGTPIRRRDLAGRNLFWCPACQQGH
ncbi:endonuclease-8/formamidopyrimidine-DNA glycosylase [Raineyella antarctica]|uniref:DNA-(apurinic or apyrimidinic site) lyase n=1 Tax=Raineyella antarctica TaxID=1577474 RepID=A0A1G6H202_9ACTN|nr:DNA-formamidopyrimidine glycosylase family protein [Raineyella antarctica]SDB88327.1 endonuclease-8/formamidopyrimidine-DNA glycosylase [Raineyella antarctica]